MEKNKHKIEYICFKQNKVSSPFFKYLSDDLKEETSFCMLGFVLVEDDEYVALSSSPEPGEYQDVLQIPKKSITHRTLY